MNQRRLHIEWRPEGHPSSKVIIRHEPDKRGRPNKICRVIQLPSRKIASCVRSFAAPALRLRWRHVPHIDLHRSRLLN